MMPHKHSAVIHAWADGAEVEFYHDGIGEWITLLYPAWCVGVEYRIKVSVSQQIPVVPEDVEVKRPRHSAFDYAADMAASNIKLAFELFGGGPKK